METISVLLALSPPVNPPHKGQWRGALMFSLICAWPHGSVNNRNAGDLRRHRAHYDATVMLHRSRRWYGAVSHQTITPANDDPILCRHAVSLGHDKLTNPWVIWLNQIYIQFIYCGIWYICHKFSSFSCLHSVARASASIPPGNPAVRCRGAMYHHGNRQTDAWLSGKTIHGWW